MWIVLFWQSAHHTVRAAPLMRLWRRRCVRPTLAKLDSPLSRDCVAVRIHPASCHVGWFISCGLWVVNDDQLCISFIFVLPLIVSTQLLFGHPRYNFPSIVYNIDSVDPFSGNGHTTTVSPMYIYVSKGSPVSDALIYHVVIPSLSLIRYHVISNHRT